MKQLHTLAATSIVALSTLVPSLAHANDCEVVRRARALLIQRGVDDSALRAIEPSVCGPVAVPVQPQPQPQPQPNPGSAIAAQACGDYRTLRVLADIDPARVRPEQRAWMDQMVAAACRGFASAREAWPNGLRSREVDGRVYYPNGMLARDRDGSWNYPSGMSLTRNGGWNWPNGMRARDAQGNWYAPSGLRSAPGALLGEACSAVRDPRFCSGRVWGEPETFEFIAFVWRARGGR